MLIIVFFCGFFIFINWEFWNIFLKVFLFEFFGVLKYVFIIDRVGGMGFLWYKYENIWVFLNIWEIVMLDLIILWGY